MIDPVSQSFSDVIYVNEDHLRNYSLVHTYLYEPISDDNDVLTLDRFTVLMKNQLTQLTRNAQNESLLFENYFNLHFIDEAKQFYFTDSYYFEVLYSDPIIHTQDSYYSSLYYTSLGYQYVWDYYHDFTSIKTYYGTYTLEEAQALTHRYDEYKMNSGLDCYFLTSDLDFNLLLQASINEEGVMFIDPNSSFNEIITKLSCLRFFQGLNEVNIENIKSQYENYQIEIYQDHEVILYSFSSFLDALYTVINQS
jgi:hypothetical protein